MSYECQVWSITNIVDNTEAELVGRSKKVSTKEGAATLEKVFVLSGVHTSKFEVEVRTRVAGPN